MVCRWRSAQRKQKGLFQKWVCQRCGTYVHTHKGVFQKSYLDLDDVVHTQKGLFQERYVCWRCSTIQKDKNINPATKVLLELGSYGSTMQTRKPGCFNLKTHTNHSKTSIFWKWVVKISCPHWKSGCNLKWKHRGVFFCNASLAWISW